LSNCQSIHIFKPIDHFRGNYLIQAISIQPAYVTGLGDYLISSIFKQRPRIDEATGYRMDFRILVQDNAL